MKSNKYGVYLVDNNWLWIQIIKMIVPFRENGFKVIGCSTDPQKAAKEIAALKPEMVISELDMGKMSGISLMKAVRNAGVDCAFILLTELWSMDVVRQFFHSGGSDYWVKPMDRRGWYEAIDTLRNVYSALESKQSIG